MMHICVVCLEDKELNHANFRCTQSVFGYDTTCRLCRSLAKKLYDQRPDVKLRKQEYNKEYNKEYRENPEAKKKAQEYHKKHSQDPNIKQKLQEYQKEYHKTHPEAKKKAQEYREKPDVKLKRQAYNREYRENQKTIDSNNILEKYIKLRLDIYNTNLTPTLVYVNIHTDVTNNTEFVKIGVTTRTVEKRYSGYTLYPYNIIIEIPCLHNSEASAIEFLLLNTTKNMKYEPTGTFGGHTECRTIECLDDILTTINNLGYSCFILDDYSLV